MGSKKSQPKFHCFGRDKHGIEMTKLYRETLNAVWDLIESDQQ